METVRHNRPKSPPSASQVDCFDSIPATLTKTDRRPIPLGRGAVRLFSSCETFSFPSRIYYVSRIYLDGFFLVNRDILANKPSYDPLIRRRCRRACSIRVSRSSARRAPEGSPRRAPYQARGVRVTRSAARARRDDRRQYASRKSKPISNNNTYRTCGSAISRSDLNTLKWRSRRRVRADRYARTPEQTARDEEVVRRTDVRVYYCTNDRIMRTSIRCRVQYATYAARDGKFF